MNVSCVECFWFNKKNRLIRVNNLRTLDALWFESLKCVYIYCHEYGLWTSVHSPPEVTRSPHGLLHYITVALHHRTTIPIIHCTDDTQLSPISHCSDYTSDHNSHTLYKPWTYSLSLPSIVSVYHLQAIATLRSPVSCLSLALPCLALPCLVCFLVFWFLPVFPGLTFALPFGLCLHLSLLLVYLDYLSAFPCWILFAIEDPSPSPNFTFYYEKVLGNYENCWKLKWKKV